MRDTPSAHPLKSSGQSHPVRRRPAVFVVSRELWSSSSSTVFIVGEPREAATNPRRPRACAHGLSAPAPGYTAGALQLRSPASPLAAALTGSNSAHHLASRWPAPHASSSATSRSPARASSCSSACLAAVAQEAPSLLARRPS